MRIERIRYTDGIFDSGREVEDPNGPYIRYVARFGPKDTGGSWEHQTFQWRFFYRIEGAQVKLVDKLRERAKEARRDADRWETLAASYDPKVAANG